MTNGVAEINEFFRLRHIKLKPQWLSAAEKVMETERKPIQERVRIIFDQWVRCDMKQSTIGQYEAPKMKALCKECMFQIESIINISTSIYDQVAKNRDRDLDIQTTPEGEEYVPRIKPTRMYRLNLTDGQNKVSAVEHEVIPELTNQKPGCKILVYSRARFNSNFLLLTPSNCQLIGGRLPSQKVSRQPIATSERNEHVS